VRKVAELLAGKAAVVQVNTQENPALAGRFGVRGIPVMYLLRSGKSVDQLGGAQTAEAVLNWFKQHQ
jgi:thioredoxin 2